MRQFTLLLVTIFLYLTSISQKKPLDHSVYDGWQSIGERLISNDGKWIVYTIDVQQGDNEMVIQSADAKYKKSISRGFNATSYQYPHYPWFVIFSFFLIFLAVLLSSSFSSLLFLSFTILLFLLITILLFLRLLLLLLTSNTILILFPLLSRRRGRVQRQQ